MQATALIAEDEPLLAARLAADLQRLWPTLNIVATVPNGRQALATALAHQADVLFLDIQMPGMTGLECAQALAEDWPSNAKPFPLIVFVTAYDQFAVQAFERAAFDYLLKPVQSERLAKTCARLKETLVSRAGASGPALLAASALENTVRQMQQLLTLHQATAPTVPTASIPPDLQVVQASAGSTITMVPIGEVLYFESADKYVRVITAEREYLIRTPLRELIQQLRPEQFWQIHRSIIVRCDAIATAHRDETGKLTLTLRGSPDRLTVSRLYADRFKAM